jgi:hypothetical protein
LLTASSVDPLVSLRTDSRGGTKAPAISFREPFFWGAASASSLMRHAGRACCAEKTWLIPTVALFRLEQRGQPTAA